MQPNAPEQNYVLIYTQISSLSHGMQIYIETMHYMGKEEISSDLTYYTKKNILT